MQSTKKYIGIGGILMLIAAGAFVALRPVEKGGAIKTAAAREAVVYKSPTCGCCANYISYLKREGFDVETVQTQDMESIKNQFGVPGNGLSCHTTIVDGKVFEGHIPVEGMMDFLQRDSDVRGITLPGMPSGAPGMPGPKVGTFQLMQFDHEGMMREFMQL